MAINYTYKIFRYLLIFCPLLGILAAPSKVLFAAEGDLELANRARGGAAMKLQFMGADLLDELVYSWTRQTPLGSKTRAVSMGVSVPIGLNAELANLLETHFMELLIKNPHSGIVPVYCGACLATTSYSASNKTIIARGAEIPELLPDLKLKADAAIYLDFEGHGSQLILRCYIVSLTDHRVIYARTLATDSSQPPSLRKASELHSISEARLEYVGILEGRRRTHLSLGLRTSIIQSDSAAIVAPFIWGTLGFETFINQRKKWLADFQLSVASLSGEHNAWQLSSRLYRHLFSDIADLIAPDAYVYAGIGYWEINGPGALLFNTSKKATAGTLAAKIAKRDYQPKAHNSAVIFGIEARTGDFIRVGVFAETFINQIDNKNLKKNIQSFGLELGVIL